VAVFCLRRETIEGMNGVDDRSEPLQLPLPLASDPREALGRYSEEENVATAFFETPRPEPHWLVQVTPFDRRLWSRERVLEELMHQSGLVHRDTLVWRGGMNNWRPIAQLEELHGGTPLPPPPRPQRRAPHARVSIGQAALLYSAAALFMASVALYALRAAGVFEASIAAGSPVPAASVAAALQAR
jgi:hypothetical protein